MTFPLYTLCAAQREAQSCVCVCVRARPHHTRMLKWSCCSFYIIVHCYLLLNESPFFFPPSDWSELVSVVNETHSDVFHVCVELSSYCPSVERLVSFLECSNTLLTPLEIVCQCFQKRISGDPMDSIFADRRQIRSMNSPW